MRAIVTVVGPDRVVTEVAHPIMVGEDFSLYLQQVPGAFLFLSSANPAKGTDAAHHSPSFDVDEDVLWLGTAAFVNLAERFLNG